jgi:hypothetical protein
MSGGKRIELCSIDEVAPGAALKVEIEDFSDWFSAGLSSR